MSGQIAQLEEFLGTTLFHRRPFCLTPPGEKLYRFIEPFFSKIDAVAADLQGGATHQIRIGSSDIVLRDHLPELVAVRVVLRAPREPISLSIPVRIPTAQ